VKAGICNQFLSPSGTEETVKVIGKKIEAEARLGFFNICYYLQKLHQIIIFTKLPFKGIFHS